VRNVGERKMKMILFSLEQCPKCEAVRGYLKGKEYEEIKLPHSKYDWTEEQKKKVDEYDVLEDLQVTAPILVLKNVKHDAIIGQLRIKKWVQDEEKKCEEKK
jgi:glutaredoxin